MTSADKDPAVDIIEAFGTFELPDETDVNDKPTIDSYDPFGVGAPLESKKESPEKKKTPVKKVTPEKKEPPKKFLAKDVKPNAVPPRIQVNFKIHEEISSVATMDPEREGASEIMVQGGVLAQMTSSDAHKNYPWILNGKTRNAEIADVTPNLSYSKKYDAGGKNKVSAIHIPKTTVGFVPIASYYFKETIDHMPLLLERRVTRKGDMVQVAVQVRSKLTNLYDLTDLSITLALPDPVIPEDVEVNVGEGIYEAMKRVITWKLSALQKGDSFMVSARCVVNEGAKDSDLKFPVILRCSSLDQISTGAFSAIEAPGYPASLNSEVISRTFRLIHRLK